MFSSLHLVECLVYYALLQVYLPLYLFGIFMIKLKIIINKIKQFTRIGYVKHSNMMPLTKGGKVEDVGCISTDEEIDFLRHRSPCYVTRMTLGVAKQLAKLVTGQQSIDLISDEQLIYTLFHTAIAYAIKWNNEKQMFCVNLCEFKDVKIFKGFYWDVRRIYVDLAKHKISIEMGNGGIFHSDSGSLHRPNYELAKLHAQICLTYYAPGFAHNYVHFVFPSAVCVYAKKQLNHEGVLFKLLAPHFRFVERLNYQALRICHATDNNQSVIDRYFCFWKSFPVNRGQFSSGIETKLHDYYIVNGSKSCATTNDRDHQLFPPEYVTEDTKIPYFEYLRQYYQVIRSFVEEMVPYIDESDWLLLSQSIQTHVPRFNAVNMVDGITTFIHLSSVVHSADHQSYLDFFARKFGCTAIRYPFHTFDHPQDWKMYEEQTGIRIDEVKRDPLLLVHPLDVMRTNCFLDVFVDYIPSPTFDLSMMKLKYDFHDSGPDSAARNFISNLRSLDGNLKLQRSTVVVENVKNVVKATGMQLVKLEQLVQSNCF
ncbi:uncharacterized protein LOC100175252 [Ciona intestinalis]